MERYRVIKRVTALGDKETTYYYVRVRVFKWLPFWERLTNYNHKTERHVPAAFQYLTSALDAIEKHKIAHLRAKVTTRRMTAAEIEEEVKEEERGMI